MTEIAPLPLRVVAPDWAGEVPSPAHDALTPAERRRWLEQHPDSYLAVTRSQVDLPPGEEMGNEELLAVGRRALDRLRSRGAFGHEGGVPQTAFYVMGLELRDISQTALVCGVRVPTSEADPQCDRLRVHELVRLAEAGHLARHLDVVGAQSSPVAFAHHDDPAISALMGRVKTAEPVADFTSPDGLRLRLWPIDAGSADGSAVAALVAEHRLYVIDGHHRYAAARAQVEAAGGDKPRLLLSALFGATQLVNTAYHRLLRPPIDVDAFFEALGQRFETRPLPDGAALAGLEDPELAFYGAGRWVAARVPSQGSPLERLDVARLDEGVLGPICEIDATTAGQRLVYLPGLGPIEDLTARVDAEGGILAHVRPIEVPALMAIADAGGVMPPKSTYFRPKLRSGVLLYEV